MTFVSVNLSVLWNERPFLARQWFQKDLQKHAHGGKKIGVTYHRVKKRRIMRLAFANVV